MYDCVNKHIRDSVLREHIDKNVKFLVSCVYSIFS